jgi:sugar-specific transcriptional regulator TrmB
MENGGELLMRIGLTKSQVELYLFLLKLGEIGRKTLLEKAHLPSEQVFRILGELQEIGLVEKNLL